MCKSILKGQNVPGTDGTYHGTDGTCPRDRRDAHQGVSRQNSSCLLVFFFPHSQTKECVGSVSGHPARNARHMLRRGGMVTSIFCSWRPLEFGVTAKGRGMHNKLHPLKPPSPPHVGLVALAWSVLNAP